MHSESPDQCEIDWLGLSQTIWYSQCGSFLNFWGLQNPKNHHGFPLLSIAYLWIILGSRILGKPPGKPVHRAHQLQKELDRWSFSPQKPATSTERFPHTLFRSPLLILDCQYLGVWFRFSSIPTWLPGDPQMDSSIFFHSHLVSWFQRSSNWQKLRRSTTLPSLRASKV